MYKLHKTSEGLINCVTTTNGDVTTSIPFDPANTDYANFKDAVNAGKAQLQDADGKTMTAEQAKQFVKELP